MSNATFLINDVPATDLANQFGTPLYIYNGNKIIHQYHTLKNAFKGIDFKIKYACKANNNINILKLLKKEGCGLDTVSIQEVELGLMAGFLPIEVLYTPNCVSIEEIKKAVEYGVRINIDNISILEQFGNIYENKSARLGRRE